MNLLSMRGVGASLGGRDVLSGVDLSVSPGERVALCGPNGAGKTSLLKAALGLLPPTTGRIEIGGRPLADLSPRERAGRIAYLPQDRRVAWNMTAREIAALGAPLEVRSEALARGDRALAEVGAEHLSDRGVAEMSGGERARVLLARALATEAPLLLVDEPTASLDPEAQLRVLDVLARRAGQGGALIASLHDLSQAAAWADRIVVLHQGRIVADGPPRQALSDHVMRSVFTVAPAWHSTPGGDVLTLSAAP